MAARSASAPGPGGPAGQGVGQRPGAVPASSPVPGSGLKPGGVAVDGLGGNGRLANSGHAQQHEAGRSRTGEQGRAQPAQQRRPADERGGLRRHTRQHRPAGTAARPVSEADRGPLNGPWVPGVPRRMVVAGDSGVPGAARSARGSTSRTASSAVRPSRASAWYHIEPGAASRSPVPMAPCTSSPRRRSRLCRWRPAAAAAACVTSARGATGRPVRHAISPCPEAVAGTSLFGGPVPRLAVCCRGCGADEPGGWWAAGPVAAAAARGRGAFAGGTGQQVGAERPDGQQPGTRQHPRAPSQDDPHARGNPGPAR